LNYREANKKDKMVVRESDLNDSYHTFSSVR